MSSQHHNTDKILATLAKRGILCQPPGSPANEREQACLDLKDVFGCRRLMKAVSWSGFILFSLSASASALIYMGISGASATAAEANKAATSAGIKADRASDQIDRVGSELKIRLDAQKETLDRILAHMRQP